MTHEDYYTTAGSKRYIKAMSTVHMSSQGNNYIERHMLDGMQHRVDGPAMTYTEHDGAGSTIKSLEFYYSFDRLMTKQQYEVTTQNDIKSGKNVTKRWYTKNGLLHNPRGAALIMFQPGIGMVKEWWINGVLLPCHTEEDFKLLSFVDTDQYFKGVDRNEKIYAYKYLKNHYSQLAKYFYDISTYHNRNQWIAN